MNNTGSLARDERRSYTSFRTNNDDSRPSVFEYLSVLAPNRADTAKHALGHNPNRRSSRKQAARSRCIMPTRMPEAHIYSDWIIGNKIRMSVLKPRHSSRTSATRQNHWWQSKPHTPKPFESRPRFLRTPSERDVLPNRANIIDRGRPLLRSRSYLNCVTAATRTDIRMIVLPPSLRPYSSRSRLQVFTRRNGLDPNQEALWSGELQQRTTPLRLLKGLFAVPQLYKYSQWQAQAEWVRPY